jgi:hypothetical protein
MTFSLTSGSLVSCVGLNIEKMLSLLNLAVAKVR